LANVSTNMRVSVKVLIAVSLVLVLMIGGMWAYAGSYAFGVLLRHGGFFWTSVKPDSPQLSPSMRLALGAAPVASPGAFQWQTIADGFETADLPALADGSAVDHILLARIDPKRFRFVVRIAPAGTRGIDRWIAELGAALVVNGSYYARDGKPATPALSDGLCSGRPNTMPKRVRSSPLRASPASVTCSTRTGRRHSRAPTMPWCPFRC
jgi:hypothetical protein